MISASTPSCQPTDQRSSAPHSEWIGWAQWIAMLTMLADHSAAFLFPDAAIAPWVRDSIGRIAFPVFAGIMAWHALYHTRSMKRYMMRVLMIGAIAQVAYMALPGYRSLALLNICFTLALGMMVYGWIGGLWSRWWRGGVSPLQAYFEMVFFPLVLFLASFFVDYGIAGVLLVPALALSTWCWQSRRWLLLAVAALGLTPVAIGLNLSNGGLAVVVTLVSIVGLLLLPGQVRGTPPIRVPHWLWRAWYPGHLALIVILVGVGSL